MIIKTHGYECRKCKSLNTEVSLEYITNKIIILLCTCIECNRKYKVFYEKYLMQEQQVERKE